MRELPSSLVGRHVAVAMAAALVAVATIVAVVASRTGGGIGPSKAPEPNIVLILTDDQRWDTMSVMPEVRRLLGTHGVTFANALVTTSLCCPSRATILTGQYSRHTGVYENTLPHGGARSFRDQSTVATWLHDAGYRTALVGKYLNDYSSLPGGYIPPGWDEWDAIAQRDEIRYYGYDLNENGSIVHYDHHKSDYSTTVLGNKAVEFIRGADSPFFLYFAPIAPHEPSIPAPQDKGLYSGIAPWRPASYNDASGTPWKAFYPPLDQQVRDKIDRIHEQMLESLRAVDRSVAQIVSAVRAKGALDHSVIVFASDNGYLWGEHRLKGKIWPYEESIRVPLVVRTPWASSTRTDRHLVTNADLASTFAGLAGVKPPLPQDGRSLVPLLRREAVDWPSAVLVEYLGTPGLARFGPPPFEAVRTERYLYVEYRNGWGELYDVQRDPLELDNLFGKPGEDAVQSSLARTLAGLLRS